MFKKILIANRGEIACRIMATAARMGIRTVAVYSEADADALHVDLADEAVPIGPAPAAESYLVADRIVAAARETGAEAVHPGYGFLSENAAFCRALEEAGITFIGPGADAIALMGDKIESKRLAEAAGVATIPGHADVIADADEAVRVAGGIGFPVMIKAAAGGGGKGMRVARSEEEVREGFRLASSEAESSFGDPRIFIEKFIEDPRHVEIQILADAHGNVIHLGERECSIQRRHQKILEESPSPALDEETRAAMGAQAVALARRVGYRSAGTVEFILDRERNFYFLEMNTRLQVEHPVTEFVTGLDLVEEMIRIAAGEKLRLAQSEVAFDGWAVEARVYAEDPFRNFLPSTGRLVRYLPPETDGRTLRIDSGVVEGGEISMHYDPMIAKVIAHGPDRAAAIRRLAAALDAFYVRGVRHNMPFLAAVLAHPRFVEGRLSTNFIDEEYPAGFGEADQPREDPGMFAAFAALIHACTVRRELSVGGRLAGYGREAGDEWVVVENGERMPVRVAEEAGVWRIAVGERSYGIATDWRYFRPLIEATVNGEPVCLQVDRVGPGYRLLHRGVTAEVLVLRPRVAELHRHMPVKAPPDTSKFLLSPMPGLLVSLAVEVGQEVKAGEELALVEAMKMENVLRADRDGKVVELHARPGDSLAVDQPILEFA